jgi:hypothetical protein
MMNDKIKMDQEISQCVRSIEVDIPPGVEDRIRKAATAHQPHVYQLGMRRSWLLAIIPSVAVILAAMILLVPALRQPLASPIPPISEIRTDFELPDKNIKIVFFQRPDFKLF